MAAWVDLLNEINRDQTREKPTDAIQWAADWFQAKLKQEVRLRGSRSGDRHELMCSA